MKRCRAPTTGAVSPQVRGPKQRERRGRFADSVQAPRGALRRRPLAGADAARGRRRGVPSPLTARITLRWIVRNVRSAPGVASLGLTEALASWRFRLRFSLISASTLSRSASISSGPRRRGRRVRGVDVLAAFDRRRRVLVVRALGGLSGTFVMCNISPGDRGGKTQLSSFVSQSEPLRFRCIGCGASSYSAQTRQREGAAARRPPAVAESPAAR